MDDEECLLCGQPFGEAQFIVSFKDSKLHVCCEQEILNEPYLIFDGKHLLELYPHGIREDTKQVRCPVCAERMMLKWNQWNRCPHCGYLVEWGVSNETQTLVT